MEAEVARQAPRPGRLQVALPIRRRLFRVDQVRPLHQPSPIASNLRLRTQTVAL
jgi:hypothetical protein